MRLLIVEDEVDLAVSLAEGLTADGHDVEVVHDGASALDLLELSDPDVVVLDRDLPIVHGDTVCRAMAALRHPARILMLTAAATVDQRVAGLDLGADDYLTKPFAYRELKARIDALGRRLAPPDDGYRVADLHLDPRAQRVTRGGAPVRLSPKEHAVLETLLRADGALVSYRQLLDAAWDGDYDTERTTVRTLIRALRRKLGPPDLLVAIPSRGYRLEAPEVHT